MLEYTPNSPAYQNDVFEKRDELRKTRLSTGAAPFTPKLAPLVFTPTWSPGGVESGPASTCTGASESPSWATHDWDNYAFPSIIGPGDTVGDFDAQSVATSSIGDPSWEGGETPDGSAMVGARLPFRLGSMCLMPLRANSGSLTAMSVEERVRAGQSLAKTRSTSSSLVHLDAVDEGCASDKADSVLLQMIAPLIRHHAVPAHFIEVLHQRLAACPPEFLCAKLAALMEALKVKPQPTANAMLLDAVRDYLAGRGVVADTALGELMLARYSELQRLDDFDILLSQLEDRDGTLDPKIAQLALKGALHHGDLELALKRFNELGQILSLCGAENETPAQSIPQCLLQQLVRLAAQRNSEELPRILAKLSEVRITCETFNTLLTECLKCGDLASFRSAESMGRSQGVRFNTVSYCMLLQNAGSGEDVDRLLDEAMQHGTRTKYILGKAADAAAETGNNVLADAILRRVSGATACSPRQHDHVIGVLKDFPPSSSSVSAGSSADVAASPPQSTDGGATDDIGHTPSASSLPSRPRWADLSDEDNDYVVSEVSTAISDGKDHGWGPGWSVGWGPVGA